MKRFNLSAWAVGHPTLILFLMIGSVPPASFLSAAWPRRGSVLHGEGGQRFGDWPGATAQEMQTQVADPIEKKLQELPYFEKVQTYSAVVHGDAGHVPGLTRPGRAYCLSAAQEARRRAGPVAAGLLGPTVNDEFSDVDSILYMMTGEAPTTRS
jgi:hypothetical protein